MPEQELFTLHYITLHYIIYRYGFTLVFCNLHCIHQRKLQWVKPPRVQVEYLCQLLREKHHHRKLVPVTTTVRTRCKGQGAGGVHNAAIIVTCVRVHNSNFFHALS